MDWFLYDRDLNDELPKSHLINYFDSIHYIKK